MGRITARKLNGGVKIEVNKISGNKRFLTLQECIPKISSEELFKVATSKIIGSQIKG